MCGMCEAHVNDAIRREFPVGKVSSSRKKGRDGDPGGGRLLDLERLKETVRPPGTRCSPPGKNHTRNEGCSPGG